MNRAVICLLFAALFLAAVEAAPALERPEWMDSPGIVLAGSWEAPCFRARRMGRLDYTLPPDKLEPYRREHSDETIARLKEWGVNLIIIHGYKGAGLATERQGMEDAKRFAESARKAGLRVGAYIGGTMFYERLFQEEPEAHQWQARGPRGEPLFYNSEQTYRYAAVRNHPGFIEYLKKPVRYAVEQMHADLIHFDNFGSGGSSYDPFSKQQYREYLKARGKAPADPPATTDSSNHLERDWTDYKCRALARHYAEMSRFIRSLNPRCAVASNPGGLGDGGKTHVGIDYPRLLPLGNAFFDEGFGAEWRKDKGTAKTRIRSLKAGQLYNNSTFLYCETPLDLAECMAFNLNCLGSVAWFEWGDVTTAHLTGKPIPPEMKSYIRFFLDRQDLFRHSPTVADVAVLRTFLEQSFGPRRYLGVEQGLIQGHAAWRIIFDEQLDDLDGYRVVVAPDDDRLTPRQQKKLEEFSRQGGRLVRSSTIGNPREFVAGLRDRLRAIVDAPPSVALELAQQENPRRVLVHLVNYDTEQTLGNLPITLRFRGGAPRSVRVLSPDPAEDRVFPVRVEGDTCSFTLPRLKIYALAVFDETAVR